MARDTLRYGFYAAVVAVLLALTGMFGKFAVLYVISEQLTLSTVVLILVIGATAYYTARRVREHGAISAAMNGLAAAVMVGIALALVVLIEVNVNLTFVFENLNRNPMRPVLTFGQELVPGLALLLIISAILGIVTGALVMLPARVRRILLSSLGLLVVLGLLESQLRQIVTLPDMLAIIAGLALGYITGLRFATAGEFPKRVAIGAAVGIVMGVVLAVIASSGGQEAGGILLGIGSTPKILSQPSPLVLFVVVFGILGAFGALIAAARQSVHNSTVYIVSSLFIIGILNARGGMDTLAALITFLVFLGVFWFTPQLGNESEGRFVEISRSNQRVTWRIAFVIAFIILLVAPGFVGQRIADVVDRVGLFVIMGIGLNIVIGYAGLLDLGYAAFFAIGAYSVGVLTTPSLVTCGGVHPEEISPETITQVCTGVLTFWQAWPLAILIAALAGILLGIPVLRLRGDYLAIVTLGFGEIIRLLTLSNELKPLLGSAQGIARIPGPVIDLTALNPAFRFELGNAVNIYYIILMSVVITAIIAVRLANTRLGRAWRAMRADQDVAQATGINLVRAKLLAFAIGAAFAGMGGGIFASWLQGIFPNSFGVLVSINVVSLIIIGGLGSIPGVVVGALILVGLPEVLRELQDYRLLAFGVLLVVSMLLRPEGMIPPPVRRLSEIAAEHHKTKEGAGA
jgi:branched-chain amino acid transport system permease protein